MWGFVNNCKFLLVAWRKTNIQYYEYILLNYIILFYTYYTILTSECRYVSIVYRRLLFDYLPRKRQIYHKTVRIETASLAWTACRIGELSAADPSTSRGQSLMTWTFEGPILNENAKIECILRSFYKLQKNLFKKQK